LKKRIEREEMMKINIYLGLFGEDEVSTGERAMD
jgi:hypothetical protein